MADSLPQQLPQPYKDKFENAAGMMCHYAHEAQDVAKEFDCSTLTFEYEGLSIVVKPLVEKDLPEGLE